MRHCHRRCGRIAAAALGVAVAAMMQSGGAYAGTVTWVGAGSGTWSDAVNWSSNPALPGAGDDVVIGGETVTIHGGTQAARSLTAGGGLTLTGGGTLSLSADSTIAGPLTIEWTALWVDGGVLTSAGHLTLAGGGSWANGSLTGPGTTTVPAGATLAIAPGSGFNLRDGQTLENAGQINVGPSSGALKLWGSAINNLAGATFNISDGSVGWGDLVPPTGTVFNNAGTVNASGTRNDIGVPFNNTGTFNKSGTSNEIFDRFDNSGTVNLTGGKMRLYNGGTQAGAFVIAPGAALEFVGGTHTIDPSATFSGPVALRGDLTTLNFTSDNTVWSDFTWGGGRLTGAGKTIVPADTTFTIGGGVLDHRDLENAGTINFVDGSSITLTNSTLYNLAGATINTVQNYLGQSGVFGSEINNAGTFNKSGKGPWTIYANFNNSGTVNVTGGRLKFSGNDTQTGAFVIAPGAAIEFTSGTHTIDPSATFSGPVVLNGAALSYIGDNIVPDGFSWTDGRLTGAGKSVVPANCTVTIRSTENACLLKSRSMENAGTIDVGADDYGLWLWSATLWNLPGATINFHSDGKFGLCGSLNFIDGTNLLDNAGTINISGTMGWIIATPFSNTGTVNVRTGRLRINNTLAQLSGGALTAGTWNVSDNAAMTMGSLTNIDTIGPAASVTLDGPNAAFDNLGTLANVQGSFAISGGRSFTTVGGLTNSGELAVGTGSTLKVAGDLVSSGTITNDGTIDLVGNRMVLDYASGSLADWLRGQLLSGRNGGAWVGAAGVLSSAAAGDAQRRMGIGYAEASLLGVGLWGNTGVDRTAVVAELAYYGDANLDGVVGADDFVLLDRGLARRVADAHWTDGDFNYDGVVDQNDYLLADRVFVEQGGAMSPDFLARREAQFGPAYVAALVTSVPEPSVSVAGLILVGAAVQRRRRREA